VFSFDERYLVDELLWKGEEVTNTCSQGGRQKFF
jgi:hypothetical protein